MLGSSHVHRADPSTLIRSIHYARKLAYIVLIRPRWFLALIMLQLTPAFPRMFFDVYQPSTWWEDEGVGGCNAGFTSDALTAEHIHRLDTVFWHKARHQVVCPCQSTETMLALVLLDHTLLSDSIIGVDTATSPSSADMVHRPVER